MASNIEVDLDELHRARGALGEVVAVNEAVARLLPPASSPASRDAAPGSVVGTASRALAAYGGLVARLGQRQRYGIEAIAETRRRLVEIEAAYRAADQL